MKPGPRVGEILKAVYEQQLDGAVTTLDEAHRGDAAQPMRKSRASRS